ncbi:tripartite tricarboxylate transporter substrate binding protein [soil metagenome]
MFKRSGRRRALASTANAAFRVVGLALAAVLATVSNASAAGWPEAPITLIAPSTPGATPDVFARILADELRTRLGQPVVVVNKAGAGGMIAVQAAANAKPDGYTFAVSPPGPLGVNTLLYKKMPYDPATDLSYVMLAVTQSNVLAVRSSLNVSTLKELLALLRAQPEKYTYASVGLGSINHLCMELLAMNSATHLTRIAYSGTPQALMAMVSGEIDMGCLPAQAVIPQITAGTVKALAVATTERSAFLPDVPTLKEAGIAGVEASSWMGVVAPAGTPASIVKRMSEEIGFVLQQPAAKARLATQFMEAVDSSPSRFVTTVKEDVERWKPVITTRRIELE